MDKIEALASAIKSAQYIVFFGGAGVSTESHIPDFRSKDGIYHTITKYGTSPEFLLSHTYFMENTANFFTYYKESLVHPKAQPNLAHIALATLEKQGLLKAVITQNVDNLHQMAGSKNVLELHGSIYRNYCMNCHKFFTLDYVLSSLGTPKCDVCGHIVKPDVVLYEEGLDPSTIQESIKHISKADLLIIGGTSLNVYPAASLLHYYRGKKLIIINKEITSFDQKADLVIQDNIGKVLDMTMNRLQEEIL